MLKSIRHYCEFASRVAPSYNHDRNVTNTFVQNWQYVSVSNISIQKGLKDHVPIKDDNDDDDDDSSSSNNDSINLRNRNVSFSNSVRSSFFYPGNTE
jgi:hypothetical protein